MCFVPRVLLFVQKISCFFYFIRNKMKRIVVGIIDTGLDTKCKYFLRTNYEACSVKQDGNVSLLKSDYEDKNGHGTACASIIINECPNVEFFIINAFGESGKTNLVAIEKALKILKKVHDTFGVPTVTDIHSAEEAAMAAEYADVLQIPAFLCRQTDILVAAAKTGKVVNIKKGQFLSPMAMQFAAAKVIEAGNKEVMLTERGTTFGYQDLVVDYRGIPEMQTFGYPVILDVTHSLQQPNQTSGVTGGMPQLIETVAKAGIAVGADGIFIETHENPAVAKSDGANMLKLDLLEGLLTKLVRIREAIK